MISGNIFTHDVMEMLVGMLGLKFLKQHLRFFNHRIWPCIKLDNLCCVFFFCELLVQETIFLVSETCTQKALMASDTITDKPTRSTIFTILTPKHIVALAHIDAFIAMLWFVTVVIITTIFWTLDPISIVAILIVVCMKGEITIFRLTSTVNVFTIFWVVVYSSIQMRRPDFELVNLVKHTPVPINTLAICKWVKIVSVVALQAQNFTLIGLGKIWDNWSRTMFTSISIQHSFVAPRHFSHEPTTRAPGRDWNLHGFVKFHINVCDVERCITVSTRRGWNNFFWHDAKC